MGAAYYILLENEIPGLDTMMSGEPIARADAALELAALQSGVRPLMEFYSTNAEELADILGEEEEVPEVGPEVWFPAAEGLLTVRALIAVADRNPELAPVMDDLQDMQRILVEAEKHNVRWHLAIDI